MYKYIKYYDMGYYDGINSAIKDKLINRKREFKRIKDKDIKSKLYDLGYIDGYKTAHKNISFILK